MAISIDEQHNRNAIPFSDALEKAGFGIFNCFLIFIGGCILTYVMYETSSISLILPVAECDLNITNRDMGVLNAIGYTGIICSSYLWGLLADTKGRRTVILPTLLISFVVTVMSSFSHHFWILVFLRFLNGFIISGPSSTIYAYVSEYHINRIRSRALLGCSFIYSIGAMIMPVIAWGVGNQSWSLSIPLLGIVYKPWRLFIAVCGIPGILCGLAVFLLPESPKFLLSVGKEREAIEILKKMHKWNGGHGELKIDGIIPDKDTEVRNLKEFASNSKNFAMKFLGRMWNQTVPLFQRNFLLTTIIICTLQFWLYITYFGMYMWFPDITDSMVSFMNNNPGNKSRICDIVYAKQFVVSGKNITMHCPERLGDSTYIYSMVLEILYLAGFVIIGIIINRIRKALILFFIFIVFGACGLIALHINNPPVALTFYVLLFLCGVGSSVLSGAVVELYPTHLRGMALCISLMFGRLGGVVGSNIVGLLLSNDCEMPFYISGITLIVSGFLALYLRC